MVNFTEIKTIEKFNDTKHNLHHSKRKLEAIDDEKNTFLYSIIDEFNQNTKFKTLIVKKLNKLYDGFIAENHTLENVTFSLNIDEDEIVTKCHFNNDISCILPAKIVCNKLYFYGNMRYCNFEIEAIFNKFVERTNSLKVFGELDKLYTQIKSEFNKELQINSDTLAEIDAKYNRVLAEIDKYKNMIDEVKRRKGTIIERISHTTVRKSGGRYELLEDVVYGKRTKVRCIYPGDKRPVNSLDLNKLYSQVGKQHFYATVIEVGAVK